MGLPHVKLTVTPDGYRRIDSLITGRKTSPENVQCNGVHRATFPVEPRRQEPRLLFAVGG